MSDEATMGPISYVIVEFPGNNMTGQGFEALIDLVDRGLINIIDLQFVMCDDDGSVTAVELADLDGDGSIDLAVFEGASSGLLDQSDLDDAAAALEPGTSAGILLFENRWAVDFVQGIHAGGGQVVAAGFVPLDALEESLDAIDG